jgi:hypothetical protein
MLILDEFSMRSEHFSATLLRARATGVTTGVVRLDAAGLIGYRAAGPP